MAMGGRRSADLGGEHRNFSVDDKKDKGRNSWPDQGPGAKKKGTQKLSGTGNYMKRHTRNSRWTIERRASPRP